MDMDRIQFFSDEIADDVVRASRGQPKDSNQAWADWCKMAMQGGSKPLHRVTKIKTIPSPAVAIGVQSGDPVVIVAQEVEMYRTLWKASDVAMPAW
eukprot:9495816-Pyramimonas_sp.AAC.1